MVHDQVGSELKPTTVKMSEKFPFFFLEIKQKIEVYKLPSVVVSK